MVNKCTSVKDNNTIISLIDMAIKRDYYKIFKIISNNNTDEKFQKLTIPEKDIYILKDSLFVVGDLNLILDNLVKMGYVVNKGPKSLTGQLNSM